MSDFYLHNEGFIEVSQSRCKTHLEEFCNKSIASIDGTGGCDEVEGNDEK